MEEEQLGSVEVEEIETAKESGEKMEEKNASKRLDAFDEMVYERDGFHNYMVITPVYKIRDFEVKMLQRNSGLCLLPIHLQSGKLYYDIQGFKTLERQMPEIRNDYESVWNMLYHLVDDLMHLEEYLLSADSVLLKPEMVYVNADNTEVKVCYVPGYCGNIQQEFIGFMEYLMSHIDHKEDSLVVLIYGIYHIVREDNYSLEKVQKLIHGKKKEHTVKAEKIPEETSGQIQMEPQKKFIDGEERKEETVKEEGILKSSFCVKELFLQKEILRLRQQRILWGMVTAITTVLTLFIAEETIYAHSIQNEYILYVAILGMFCSLCFFVISWRKLSGIGSAVLEKKNVV